MIKIEKNLPQFEHERVLVLLTGEKVAKFYLASKGYIEELELFSELTPTYSDREGFFERLIGGRFAFGGSVYEQQKLKREVLLKFTHKLRDKLEAIYKEIGFDAIYLFSPQFMANEILNILPPALKDKVAVKIAGNVVDEHPFKILRRLQAELKSRKVELLTEKAMQLEKKEK